MWNTSSMQQIETRLIDAVVPLRRTFTYWYSLFLSFTRVTFRHFDDILCYTKAIAEYSCLVVKVHKNR